VRLIAGIDVGNATTEVALADVSSASAPRFLASSIVPTTGIKGTVRNIPGIVDALRRATAAVELTPRDLSLVLLNEATPVIGDIAMETITETLVTESTMIGHNPASPGGLGLGVGRTMHIRDLVSAKRTDRVIVVVPRDYDFEVVANIIARALEAGVDVQGGIVQLDDGVLIANRLPKTIPFVDEVAHIDRVPLNMPAAVEVAPQGQAVRQLANPYGIASLFGLTPQETALVIPVAKALIGLRSAVVIRTPSGEVKTRRIPAGSLTLRGERQTLTATLDSGADEIMDLIAQVAPLQDVQGESGTNVGGMIGRIRQTMSEVTEKPIEDIRIRDVLAVDCQVPQKVAGGVAQEFSLENAVGLAAMVNADRLLMERVAKAVSDEIKVPAELGGVEANMAILGALTTPGTDLPLAILDLGAGSTDAALLRRGEPVRSTHLAGAGHMVTLLINSELGLGDIEVAEQVKRFPLAKVESLFHIRNEDNTVRFFKEPLDAHLFGRVISIDAGSRGVDRLLPIPTQHTMERIRQVRQEAKQKVFVRNSLRALSAIAPAGNLRLIDFVAIVGGSGLDFELPQMLTRHMAGYGVVMGSANVRGTEGPVNAVATGLVLHYFERQRGSAQLAGRGADLPGPRTVGGGVG
jgi:diol dehydratase reactivase alpha subunit